MNYQEEIENLENKIRVDQKNLLTLKQCVEELYLKVEFLEKSISDLAAKKNKRVKNNGG